MNIAEIQLSSKILFMPVRLNVILPPAASNSDETDKKKCRVLWLLHGANSDHNTYIQQTNICRYAEDRDLIIVMPNALNSDYANHPHFANGYMYTDFFFKELMPFIHGTFRASGRPEDNFLAGLSMGGSGAFLYAFNYPEKFGGVAVLSSSIRESEFLRSYKEMSSAQFREYAMANRKTLPTEYGPPSEGIMLKEINMIAKYPSVADYINSYECMWEQLPEVAKKRNLPPMYVTCGTNDDCYPKVMEFEEYAGSLGINNITYNYVEGYGHDYVFWDLALQKSLDFFESRN